MAKRYTANDKADSLAAAGGLLSLVPAHKVSLTVPVNPEGMKIL